MESITAVEDKLLNGLSFKLGVGASYISNRRSVSFQPLGSNVYECNGGTRVLRFNLGGTGFLDPDTLRVSYDMVNKATGALKNLRMLGGPYSIFRRGRLMCGGTVIEDLDNFHKISHMLQLLKSKNSRLNEQSEGFGMEWDDHAYLTETLVPVGYGYGEGKPQLTGTYSVVDGTNVARVFNGFKVARGIDKDSFEGIKPGESQRVLFKPCFGLFAESQTKFIPIEYANLVLELELVQDPNEPVLFQGLYGSATLDGDAAGTARAAMTFDEANCSNEWRIQNCEIKADLITLDDQLNASYSQHLLSGKSLSISYSTMISQTQTITGQSKINIGISRALTRLKGAFITLEKDNVIGPSKPGHRNYRSYWSPMALENGYYKADPGSVNFKHSSEGELNFQIQNGSKLYPEYPITSMAESYSHLRKFMGHKSSSVHSFAITPREYRDNKMILAIDFEKVTGGEAGWTGENTRSGQLLSIRLEYRNNGNKGDGSGTSPIGPISAPNVSNAGIRLADRLNCVLISDNILEINSNGCQVFD